MSTASDRPPARAAISSPYARLPDARTQTVTRVKAGGPSAEDNLESDPLAAPTVTPDVESPANAIPAEALRKPFASLAPQRRSEAPPPSVGESPAAPRSAPRASPQSRRTDPTAARSDAGDSRRWADTTEAKRRSGTCPKHGIARAPSGECLLCKKQQVQVKPRSSLLLLVAGAMLLGAALFSTFLYLF